LALGAGTYSPYLQQSIVRLGTWLPFEQVPAGLAHFTRVPISVETARRLTEAAGAALVAWETAEVERLAREGPPGPPGPVVQQVSVDGAMVPLVHGEWAEVKTLAIGTVERRAGRGEPRATALSYFSRLADAATFYRLAGLECHRRGTATAQTVCGVVDGAPWCQHCLDWHCPQAVRILDFAHAAEHVSRAAQAVFGAGTAALSEWLGPQLHTLKHGDPAAVLAALRALPVAAAADPAAATRDEVQQYLEARWAQIQYATFCAAGYPIGSGLVESANKLVVEARLKGSGMHWARANVNPMVALRAAACSDRWAAAWAQLWTEQRRQAAARRHARCAAKRSPPDPAPTPPPSETSTPERARRAVARLPLGGLGHGRPTADHPWRKPFLRRRSAEATSAKS
jgi:hypothetical protein